MQMFRFAASSALLILGAGMTGSTMIATQERELTKAQSATPTRNGTIRRELTKPAALEKEVETISVRVVDALGRGVADVEVKVIEVDATPADDGPGYVKHAFRTGQDGRARVGVDPRYIRLAFESRQNDQTMGWASLTRGQLSPKATDDDPATLMLLPRNHQVEGTIVDSQGKPIKSAHVRAVQFSHDANGFAMDYRVADSEPTLASAVSDETGRYRLSSLPKGTTVIFAVDQPRFVGPTFACKPDDQTIPPVTLEDAGGITGTLVDAVTGQPVARAQITCDRIERTDGILGAGGGGARTDAQGHFSLTGLAPGVYNLLFQSSPKGRRFTARAVEGVRVKAGQEARADLLLIAGRRVRGTVVEDRAGKPLVGEQILCYSSAYPRSGGACQGTYTDQLGRFEHFVPPGPTFVYIAGSAKVGLAYREILEVLDDRDPDPVVLMQDEDPNTKQRARPVALVECEVRIRLKAEVGDRPANKEDRGLSGRVFDKSGSPLVGVQVYHHSRRRNEGATDRLGIFRLKRLPQGPLRLGLRKDREQYGWASVPAEAVEIDLIVP
jgi:Carboxypeptidase regulatory-like domain